METFRGPEAEMERIFCLVLNKCSRDTRILSVRAEDGFTDVSSIGVSFCFLIIHRFYCSLMHYYRQTARCDCLSDITLSDKASLPPKMVVIC